MIKQGNVSRALSWSSLVAVCGLAGVLLPLAPGRAEETKAQITDVKTADATPITVGTKDVSTSNDLVVEFDPKASNESGSADVKDGEAESGDLRSARREVERLSRQLEKAKQRLAKIEGKNGGSAYNNYRPGNGQTKSGDLALGRGEGNVTRIEGQDVFLSRRKGRSSNHEEYEKKLADLEQNLNHLAEEIRQLRASLGGGTRPEAK